MMLLRKKATSRYLAISCSNIRVVEKRRLRDGL